MKDRIIAMDKFVTDQLLQDLWKACMISVRLDESTDVTSTACLAVITTFPFGDIIKEDIVKLVTLFHKSRIEDIVN